MSIVRFSLLLIFILHSLSGMSQHGPFVGERTYKVVRQISTDTGTGSASLLNIEDRLYILTVRHLFKKTIRSGDKVTLDFMQYERPVKVIGHILLHENEGVDLALIDIGPADPNINGFDVFNTSGQEVFASQECYFLGYPLGLKIFDLNGTINDGYSAPFIKKGIISGFNDYNEIGSMLFLDAHNNKGFSGGPVVAIQPNGKVVLVGVVANFLYDDYKKAFKDDEEREMDFDQLNSGITGVTSLKNLPDILKRRELK